METSAWITFLPTTVQPGTHRDSSPSNKQNTVTSFQVPKSLSLFQHQLKVQMPSAHQSHISMSTVSKSGTDEALGIIHSEGQVLSTYEANSRNILAVPKTRCWEGIEY